MQPVSATASGHHDPDQDEGDSRGFLAHHFPPFFGFRLDTSVCSCRPLGEGREWFTARPASEPRA